MLCSRAKKKNGQKNERQYSLEKEDKGKGRKGERKRKLVTR